MIAFLLGIGFGFFLEQGGLGNARKLAAQFYFTDMTVLKVMFTAILTAMLGLFWLDRLAVVDASAVWVVPTWIAPQLAGGLVFGVGFVMGGLCPGTSCVAAATGRLDGLMLVGGMLLGVLAFNIAWPLFASFYESTPRGAATLMDVTGWSRPVMIVAVTGMALGMFAIAERLERR